MDKTYERTGGYPDDLANHLSLFLMDGPHYGRNQAPLRAISNQTYWTKIKEGLVKTFRPPSWKLDLKKKEREMQSKDQDALEFIEERYLVCAKLDLTSRRPSRVFLLSLNPDTIRQLPRRKFGDLNDLRYWVKDAQDFIIACPPKRHW